MCLCPHSCLSLATYYPLLPSAFLGPHLIHQVWPFLSHFLYYHWISNFVKINKTTFQLSMIKELWQFMEQLLFWSLRRPSQIALAVFHPQQMSLLFSGMPGKWLRHAFHWLLLELLSHCCHFLFVSIRIKSFILKPFPIWNFLLWLLFWNFSL